ncbi:hypothetical protein [Herbidospora mongoliensis]|uniref:hypothetical protein n=1 Tax=Herbidospora mongoliensis TaxID=688067 RepID=UPI00082F8978|nr:hypothetical protein [Herbidospora mongoliensis]
MAETSHQGSHAGSAKSWVAVSIILIGTIISGAALTGLGSGNANWTMVWVGVGVSAVGGILALVFDVFSDVVIDAPRVMDAREHHSPFEH